MASENSQFKLFYLITSAVGFLLLPVVWFALHYWVGVGERFLPGPETVFFAIFDLKSNIGLHIAYTSLRFILGTVLGVFVGVGLGLIMFRSKFLYTLLSPALQSLRAVPPIAAVPFFLLWFGFSDLGRYILIVFGIGLNLAITTHQILDRVPERYRVMFRSFQLNPKKQIFSFAIPAVAEELLPTIRFSLATAVGLVIVSELLGSQMGLGHLIQVARSTFALHTVLLATILLGVIMALVDWILVKFWNLLIFWNN